MNKKLVLAITIVLSFSFLVSCSQQQKTKKAIGGVESSIVQMGDVERIKVLMNNANVRSGCSSNSPTIYNSNKNDRLNVVSKVANWYAVRLPNNTIGFIPSSQSKPVVAEDKKSTASTAPGTASGTAQGATSPKTPVTQANVTSLSADEKQMVDLVNQARSQNGVAPLKANIQLANVAETKAQDMIDNKYFSHNSPKYGSPFDMMKSFGIKYVKAGENIAGNQSVQNAFNSLMNSPGHRQNILDPNYTDIGIGIRNGGPYGKMFSQMFISRPQ